MSTATPIGLEALLEDLRAALERGVAAVGEHGEARLGAGGVLEARVGVAIGQAQPVEQAAAPSARSNR